MNNRSIFYSVFLAYAMLAPCDAAQEPAIKQAAARDAKGMAPLSQKVRIPGTDYVVYADARPSALKGTQPAPELLRAIVTWLASEFQLPRLTIHPTIRFESSARITIFRHTGFLSDDPRSTAPVPKGQREVVAAYDPLNQTILLPERWTGGTPAELSILVHEMVHHMQNVARTRYACPQASEELAYAAQERWLHLFGRNLAADFEIDGFTLLASTTCMLTRISNAP